MKLSDLESHIESKIMETMKKSMVELTADIKNEAPELFPKLI